MENNKNTELGPFLFAHRIRTNIPNILNKHNWRIKGKEGSLEIESLLFTEDTEATKKQSQIKKLPVAQFWIVREGRVSFEFDPNIDELPSLCSELAEEFRKHLKSRYIPHWAKLSTGKSVARVPRQLITPEDATSENYTLEFIQWISQEFDLWWPNLGSKSLQRFCGLTKMFPDALDDLAREEPDYCSLKQTEREEVRKSRIGQGIFRDSLIEYWNGCSVTRLSKIEVLRASHIKPWRDSDNRERLDRDNGLLLIPNLDSLFDAGFISFTNDGEILIKNNTLRTQDQELLGINETMKLSRSLNERQIEYLYHHRRLHGFPVD